MDLTQNTGTEQLSYSNPVLHSKKVVFVLP